MGRTHLHQREMRSPSPCDYGAHELYLKANSIHFLSFSRHIRNPTKLLSASLQGFARETLHFATINLAEEAACLKMPAAVTKICVVFQGHQTHS